MDLRASLSLAALAAFLLAAPSAAQNYVKAFGENIADAGDLTGRSVSVLGDVDGDGIDDWVVGAPSDEDGGVESGTAYVLTGGYYSNILQEIHGVASDNTGWVVASAGDLDQDGRDDVLVTSPGSDSLFPFAQDAGRVRIYSGATGVLLKTFTGPKVGSRLGDAAAGGGDVNADGWPDVIGGAPSWDEDTSVSQSTNEGYAAVWSGKDGKLLKSYTSTAQDDQLGSAVAFVGDLDADGREDYAIGTPGDDYLTSGPFPFLVVDGGRLDVYSGATHALLFSKLGGSGDRLGGAIAAAGDTDADGVGELLVGATGDNSDAGIVFLYEGATGTLLHSFTGLGYGPPEYFGSAVAGVGDVDKDGHDDIAIGAPMTTTSVYGGYVLVFGGDDYSQYLNTLNGPYPGDLAGAALSPRAGDLDGDGWADLLTSWPHTDSEGADSGLAVGFDFLHYQPNLGFQGPGISYLEMYGTEMYAGGQADLRMTYSAGSSPAYLLASISQLFSGFKGGILVPNIAAGLLVPFVTDASGQVKVTAIPGGGGYLIVYCQFLVKNAGYPQGWGLSNALAIELLP